ncbi:MAG: sensor histidine kinase [Imperialibacter sp.]|uniref:sensor histidine kinase n=1 Tax=Imperialibacter sp. TaxID=2038411 RepID=UPI003A8805C0
MLYSQNFWQIRIQQVSEGNNIEEAFRLDPFFELSPYLLCIAGYDGYFRRINPAVCKLLGYSQEELLARPISDFIYHEDRHQTKVHRDGLLKNVPLLDFENRYVTKGGEVVWLSWNSMPYDSKQLVYAIAKNITHKKRIEEGREALLADLAEANKDLKQLNYTTSHDLRSPVNNLLTIVDLLENSNIQSKVALELIPILKSATENLNQTLNDYLNIISQKESQVAPIEELDLKEVLGTVVNSINSLAKNANAQFEIDFSEATHIRFNRAYLESIFLNLITNSIKYRRLDVVPVISISSTRLDNAIQLVFSDNGLGFDMSKVKGKIFGLHQRFHNHSDSKGIGLYLVHNHVTSLGGNIEVESEVNKGTKFTISFDE